MAEHSDWGKDGEASIQSTCHVHQLQTFQCEVCSHNLKPRKETFDVRMSGLGIKLMRNLELE